jgi:hypothetical protein
MKTCATCNASHKNTVERVLRCMGCVAKPSGNSNWRPLVPNVAGNRLARHGQSELTGVLGGSLRSERNDEC